MTLANGDMRPGRILAMQAARRAYSRARLALQSGRCITIRRHAAVDGQLIGTPYHVLRPSLDASGQWLIAHLSGPDGLRRIGLWERIGMMAYDPDGTGRFICISPDNVLIDAEEDV